MNTSENTEDKTIEEEDSGLTCTGERLAPEIRRIPAMFCSDQAFMGATHSLSAVTLTLTLIFFFPATVASILGVNNPWVLVMVTLVASGFALVPDLDNSASKAKSAFGVVGSVLATVFRSSSLVIQTTIRKKADDANPDPHRGFWHTPVSALLIGAAVYGLTRIEGSVDLPYIGELTTGTAIGFFVAFCAIHLMLKGLFEPVVQRVRRKAGMFGGLAAVILSAVLTVILMVNLPPDIDMWWLGVACAYGCIVHILGDAFTKKGVPIWWPIIGLWKHKMWWNSRFFITVEASGDKDSAEQKIVVPLLTGVAVVMFVLVLIPGIGGL